MQIRNGKVSFAGLPRSYQTKVAKHYSPHKATEAAEVEVALALALGIARPGGGEFRTTPTWAPEVPA